MKGIRSVPQGAFMVILVNLVCNSFLLHLMGILLNKYPSIHLENTQSCIFCGPSVDLLMAKPTKSSLLPTHSSQAPVERSHTNFVYLTFLVLTLRVRPVLDEPATGPTSLAEKIDFCLLLSIKRIMMNFNRLTPHC